MNALQTAARIARTHTRWLVVGLLLAVAATGAVLLDRQARDDDDARRSAEARQFEDDPEGWLSRQRNASDFRQALQSGALAAVGLAHAHPGLVLYTLKNGDRASTRVPGCTPMGCAGTDLDRLGDRSAHGGFALVDIDVDPRPPSRRWSDMVHEAGVPMLLVALLVLAAMAAPRLQAALVSRADLLAVRPATRFDDVIGSVEAKAALRRVQAFLREPSQYARLGAVAPRGVLLVGPPGVGKTLLARALAGESQASFISVDGSFFTSTYYGAGIAKVKALFRQARQHAPCVLFIDEIDGIGRRSRGGEGAGTGAESEMNRIINRVLVEMDGFSPLDNVVVVGATNHESNIDEAMRRPGRFDMLVRLSLPTLPERRQLFDLYIGKVRHDGRSDTAALARMTAGASPAEIASVVNKATSSAAESAASQVAADHFLRAIETHQLGGEVSPIKDSFTPDLRARLAYHEAGHALVGHRLAAGRVERVTIEPRGQALGVTYITRDTEDPLYKQAELTSRLAMMLAGRETELLVFGSVSTGASDDLKRASELAIDMVGSLGFSQAFGLLSVAGVPKALLGPDIQAAVLAEARLLLEDSQATCRDVLTAHRARLDALATRLLECDVVGGDELRALLDGPSAAAVRERLAEVGVAA